MFTKDGCGYCTMAKDILNEEGIPYVEKVDIFNYLIK